MQSQADSLSHSSQNDRFSSQPLEVLRNIFQKVSRRSDLVNLCGVCKLFSQIATPLLYARLEIKCPEGYNPRTSTLKHFSKTSPQIDITSNLGYVKDLALTTKFVALADNGQRCWHQRFEDEEGSEERALDPDHPGDCKYDADDFDEDEDSVCNCVRCTNQDRNNSWDVEPRFYEEDFLEFCCRLSDDALRSFRWELGSCVPQNILGADGYLPQHQTSLESIALITDGACDVAMDGENEYDLTKFVNIRSFSWTGPQAKEDFDAIKDCLTANAGHLEVLNLDLLNWSKADDFWYIEHTRWSDEPTRRKNFFAEDILGLPWNVDSRSSCVCFPVLQHLLLGQVSFDSAITQLVNAFSFFQLKQLKLWNCPQTSELLEHLTEARQDMELESLEITCGYEYGDNNDKWELEFTVPPFLQKLSRLRDLYLCLPLAQWDTVMDSVCSQLETLERVAIHARAIDIDDESPSFEEEVDGEPGFYDGHLKLLTQGHCDVVGIQYPPDFARNCLEPHAHDVSCRLLHLRAAGDSLTRRDYEFYVDREEVDSFADWVFGPDGFPELLVLAYGDFAFPDIHKDDNVLYCRNNVAQGEEVVQPTHFKILEPADEPLWDWVQGNMDALSACAYKPFLRV